MRRFLIASAMLLAATPAYSAQWTVDKTASHLTFTGKQANDPFTGEFADFTPVIDFDPAHPETGHIRVTIAMASAHIAADREQNDALPTEDWFSMQKFPSAMFESTAIRATGVNKFEAAGNLTLRNVTQPVTLAFTLTPQGTATRAEGETTLQRNAFGLGGSQWKDDKWIAYPVTVKFSLVATPQ